MPVEKHPSDISPLDTLVLIGGKGDIAVGPGDYAGVPALAVWSMGQSAELNRQHPGSVEGRDPLLVVTFPALASVDAWITVLQSVRQSLLDTTGAGG